MKDSENEHGSSTDSLSSPGEREVVASAPNASEEPLLPYALQLRNAAKFCGVSRRTWQEYDRKQLIPAGIKHEGVKIWLRPQLKLWMHWGCPCRRTFNGLWAEYLEEHPEVLH